MRTVFFHSLLILLILVISGCSEEGDKYYITKPNENESEYIEIDPNCTATLVMNNENISLNSSHNTIGERTVYINVDDGSTIYYRTNFYYEGFSDDDFYRISLSIYGGTTGIYTNPLYNSFYVSKYNENSFEYFYDCGKLEKINVTNYGSIDNYINVEFSGILLSNKTGNLIDVSGEMTVKRSNDIYRAGTGSKDQEIDPKYIPTLVIDNQTINFNSDIVSNSYGYFTKYVNYNAFLDSVFTEYTTNCRSIGFTENYRYYIYLSFSGKETREYESYNRECSFNISISDLNGNDHDLLTYISSPFTPNNDLESHSTLQTVIVNEYGEIGEDISLTFSGKVFSKRNEKFIDVSGSMIVIRDEDELR